MTRRPEPTVEDQALRARLGDDLWTLTTETHAALALATTLTAAQGSARGTFRLVFTDGLVVKGRRCEDAVQAARVERLVPYLDPRHFPRVLKRRGRALLEAWVDGWPPSALGVVDALSRRGGAILAGVHAAAVPEELQVDARAYAGSSAARLTAGVEDLVRLEALSRDDGARACELALAKAPTRFDCALLAHGDFCVENMLVDRAGEVHMVDNETVLVQPPEYDLARSWYRWPLPPAERAAFDRGYGPSPARAAFRAHFDFWAVLVLVEAALFRQRVGADRRVPLGRLRALLRRSGPAARR